MKYCTQVQLIYSLTIFLLLPTLAVDALKALHDQSDISEVGSYFLKTSLCQ